MIDFEAEPYGDGQVARFEDSKGNRVVIYLDVDGNIHPDSWMGIKP